MYKIVFSDLDGTLLTSAHHVSPATRACILRLQAENIQFVPVSGRSPSGIYTVLRQNGLTAPLVAYSGALILDEGGHVLFENGMTIATAEAIINHIEKERMPLTWCLYSYDDWIVRDRTDPKVGCEEKIVEAQATEGNTRTIAANGRVHKILCICDKDSIGAIERNLQQGFPDIHVTRSSSLHLEIMNRGVDKANAVRLFCDLLAIKPSEAIALGDNYNDVEMLKAVGCGIPMGNAPKAIRKQFAFVADDNNNDGAARALAHILAAPGPAA